jgi:hypothetical protein
MIMTTNDSVYLNIMKNGGKVLEKDKERLQNFD